MAFAYAARLHTGWAPVDRSLELALTHARLAAAQDGEDPWAHLALGFVHAMSRQFRQAVEELTASLALNPNFAFAHAMLGMAYGYAGHADEGLQRVSLAMRLSPRDPQQARYLSAVRRRGGFRTPISRASTSLFGGLANIGGGGRSGR